MQASWKRLGIPIFFYLAASCLIEVILEMSDAFAADRILWDTLFRAIVTVPVLIRFYREDQWKRKIIRMSWKTAALYIGGGAFLSVLFGIIFAKFGAGDYEKASEALLKGSAALQGIVLLLASPLMEELFFRGMLYERLKEFVSIKTAILLSAVCFGLYHGNLSQGIYGCLMGILMACAMEYSRTIAAPWLIHVAANLAALLLEW